MDVTGQIRLLLAARGVSGQIRPLHSARGVSGQIRPLHAARGVSGQIRPLHDARGVSAPWCTLSWDGLHERLFCSLLIASISTPVS